MECLLARLLILLMIVALVVTPGVSMASALCQHRDPQAHQAARQSDDLRIAAASLREEAAEAGAAKKSPPSADFPGHWPAPMLPADSEAGALRQIERVRLRPALDAALPSATVPPLLQPPSA